MKLLIQVNNTNDFNIRCDGFILGLKDYSNFTSLTFDVEEVINIQNKCVVSSLENIHIGKILFWEEH